MVALNTPNTSAPIGWPNSHARRWEKWRARLGHRLWRLMPFLNDWSVEAPPPQNAPQHWLRAGSRTVKGNYRQQNEDRCYVDLTHGLLLIVDGMGGYVGGELASQIVIDTVSRDLVDNLADLEATTGESVQQAVHASLEHARRRMVQRAVQNPDLRRMGATLALALIVDNVFYFARVGDCRVYLIRKGRIRPLTSDETLVQSLLDHGLIAKEEAKRHPWRNRVLNAVSANMRCDAPEVESMPLLPGDKIVLTTDGLTTVVEDQQLNQIVNSQGSPQEAADALVLEALRQDSKDNVSCIVLKASPRSAAVEQAAQA